MPALAPAFAFALGLLLLQARVHLHAQPAPATEPPTQDIATRLQQAEATYQLKLREIHAPILQDYLRKLEALQTKLENPDQLAEVTKEVQKIRQIIATTGILPADLSTKTEPAPPASPEPDRPEPTLSLSASEALSPAPVTPESRQALPLGSIAWKVSKLPAGNYDVMLVFAARALTADEPIMLTLGTHQLVGDLKADQATGSDDTFRVFKLGNIAIDAPLTDQPLTLQNGNPTVPKLRIRNVLFVRPSPN